MQEKVTKAIHAAIDEVNLQLPENKRIRKDPDAELVSSSSGLDSLGLLNLIVQAEQHVEEQTGIAITLADDELMSQAASPFRTVGSLIAFVCHHIGSEQGQ